MYNLLVSYSGWAPRRDEVDGSRFLEFTADYIKERFAPGGTIDADALQSIPTLFLSETGGSGVQEARVGQITNLVESSRKVRIEYAFDRGIDPFPNSYIKGLSEDLDISPFEFTRSHWAVKDANLYEALLKGKTIVPFEPSVFDVRAGNSTSDRLVSVMMPFDEPFKPVYETLKTVSSGFSFDCLRADDIWENDSIIQDVVSLIERSMIVVADCSGRNPNVFYEIGIAHTLGKSVVLITQSDRDVPFDLRHLRYATYHNNEEGRAALAAKIKPRFEHLLNGN